MARVFIVLLSLFCIFATFAQNAMAANDLAINSLRIGTHPDSTRMVIELSRKADFRAFMLQSPSRLVIDLPAFVWKAPMPSPVAGSMIGTIRNGILQPGISRIVIDLAGQCTLKSAFALPAGPGVPDRVVIDFSKVNGAYDPAKERMYGSLNTQNPDSPASPTTEVLSAAAIAPAHTLKLPPNYTSPDKPARKNFGNNDEDRTISAPPVIKADKGKKLLVVIDPGHGGEDPGAPGANGTNEKNVTLAVAKELGRQLEDSGRYRVHLTRSTDIFIKLQDRVAIARAQGADLFISLHADSIDKPGVSGASIYTLSNKASDAQTAKLAARENQADLIAGVDLSHEDKQVANILIDLAMRDTMNQSKFFANTVVKQAQRQGIQLLEKPHRFAGFAVLKAPDIPSVLIEMGFMSNRHEVSQLTNAAYREKLAGAIMAGVDGYFAKVKK